MPCIICDQPAVREQVDALLEKGVTGNQVAIQLHLARATCYRHKRKCFVKRKEASCHFKRFDPNTQRLLIAWDSEHIHHHPSGQPVALTDLRDSDEILTVEYERPQPEAAAIIAQREAEAIALEPQPEILPAE